jgi:hypothetical protein
VTPPFNVPLKCSGSEHKIEENLKLKKYNTENIPDNKKNFYFGHIHKSGGYHWFFTIKFKNNLDTFLLATRFERIKNKICTNLTFIHLPHHAWFLNGI